LLSIVQLSRFFLLFFSSDSFYILSKAFLFVKNFFNFFQSFLLALLVLTSQLRYNTICSSQCQYFFQSFSFSFEPVLYHL